VDWHKETCDGSSTGARASAYGGHRFRMVGRQGINLGEYSVTDLPKVYQPEAGHKGVSEYDHGVIFISINEENYIAAVELFYTDASEKNLLYGTTLWQLEADSLGTPIFCTWRE
jgi:hypothetical protein